MPRVDSEVQAASQFGSLSAVSREMHPVQRPCRRTSLRQATHGARRRTRRRTSMQYLLLLYANEAGWNQLTPEQQEQGKAAYMAYGEALRKAGAFVGSNRLKPVAKATTVRIAKRQNPVPVRPSCGTKAAE